MDNTTLALIGSAAAIVVGAVVFMNMGKSKTVTSDVAPSKKVEKPKPEQK
jgi:hypothetical protein